MRRSGIIMSLVQSRRKKCRKGIQKGVGTGRKEKEERECSPRIKLHGMTP